MQFYKLSRSNPAERSILAISLQTAVPWPHRISQYLIWRSYEALLASRASCGHSSFWRCMRQQFEPETADDIRKSVTVSNTYTNADPNSNTDPNSFDRAGQLFGHAPFAGGAQ